MKAKCSESVKIVLTIDNFEKINMIAEITEKPIKIKMDPVITRKIKELEKSIQQLHKFQSYSYKEI